MEIQAHRYTHDRLVEIRKKNKRFFIVVVFDVSKVHGICSGIWKNDDRSVGSVKERESHPPLFHGELSKLREEEKQVLFSNKEKKIKMKTL